jgi:DNA-binding transcriptional LysR family regulator
MIDNVLIFVKLAELKSYTATAKHFQSTKSTISRKIDLLELYFNKSLILRTSKSFSLTEEGKFLYRKFQTLPQQMEDAYNSLNKINKVTSGTLRIMLTAILSLELITPYINHFKKQYPEIVLNIDFSHEVPNMENYDIALTSRIHKVNEKKYNIEFARNEPIQLYVTPQYAKKYGIPLEIDDIKSHSIIGALDLVSGLPIIQTTLRNKYTKEITSLDLSHSQINVIPANHALKMGLQHNHIFWGYESLCKNLVKTGNLIHVLNEYYFEQLEFFIVQKKIVSHEESVFINFLRRCMNGMIEVDVQNTR